MNVRVTRKARAAWVEGVVNRTTDHVSITYGEDCRAVALVERRAKEFRVQFLLKARANDSRSATILNDVRKELTFYLLDVVGPDSWPFVQYHCTTPANTRSRVRWNWHSKPA